MNKNSRNDDWDKKINSLIDDNKAKTAILEQVI